MPSDFDPSSPTTLSWVRRARATLVIVGIGYGLLGLGSLVFFPLYGEIMTELEGLSSSREEAMATSIFTGMGVVVCLFSLAFGILNLITARALRHGKKWAWYASVILGALYAPSICLPFGVILLYGMLQDDVRARFLD